MKHRATGSPSSVSPPSSLSSRSASSGDLAHFSGVWTPDEQALLQAAIEHIESTFPDTAPTRSLGEPWVCTCQRVHDGRRFSVHRAGFSHPYSAPSAASLARLLLAERS